MSKRAQIDLESSTGSLSRSTVRSRVYDAIIFATEEQREIVVSGLVDVVPHAYLLGILSIAAEIGIVAAHPSPWQLLPRGISGFIYQYLIDRDMFVVETVCKNWKAASKAGVGWSEQTLSSKAGKTSPLDYGIRLWPALRSLDLSSQRPLSWPTLHSASRHLHSLRHVRIRGDIRIEMERVCAALPISRISGLLIDDLTYPSSIFSILLAPATCSLTVLSLHLGYGRTGNINLHGHFKQWNGHLPETLTSLCVESDASSVLALDAFIENAQFSRLTRLTRVCVFSFANSAVEKWSFLGLPTLRCVGLGFAPTETQRNFISSNRNLRELYLRFGETSRSRESLRQWIGEMKWVDSLILENAAQHIVGFIASKVQLTLPFVTMRIEHLWPTRLTGDDIQLLWIEPHDVNDKELVDVLEWVQDSPVKRFVINDRIYKDAPTTHRPLPDPRLLDDQDITAAPWSYFPQSAMSTRFHGESRLRRSSLKHPR